MVPTSQNIQRFSLLILNILSNADRVWVVSVRQERTITAMNFEELFYKEQPNNNIRVC